MNKKGFTMIELLAVIVILACVLGIGYASINGVFKDSKEETEKVFINTIKDAIDIYIDTDGKNLSFNDKECCKFNKRTNGENMTYLYKSKDIISMNTIINSSYKPLNASDMINPANDQKCDLNALVLTVYRDSDFVYYYKLELDPMKCTNDKSILDNLPGGCQKCMQ